MWHIMAYTEEMKDTVRSFRQQIYTSAPFRGNVAMASYFIQNNCSHMLDANNWLVCGTYWAHTTKEVKHFSSFQN